MKVVYTAQSLMSLEEALRFLLAQDIPVEKVALILEDLLNKADSLAANPHKGQREPYLEHLKEGHRRIVAGHFKVIYKVDPPMVFITDFFDTRQSPGKMKG